MPGHLGQFDQQSDGDSLFVFSGDPTGPSQSPRNKRTHLLDVTASVVGCVVALVMAFYLVSREMTPLTVIVVSVLSGIVAAAAAS